MFLFYERQRQRYSLHHRCGDEAAVLYRSEWRGEVGGVGGLHHLFVPVHHIQVAVKLFPNLFGQLHKTKKIVCGDANIYLSPTPTRMIKTYFTFQATWDDVQRSLWIKSKAVFLVALFVSPCPLCFAPTIISDAEVTNHTTSYNNMSALY